MPQITLRRTFTAVAIGLTIFATAAIAAIAIVNREAADAERALRACIGNEAGLIDCVATSLEGLGNGIQSADVPQIAPQAAPTVKTAASQVRAAPNRAAALSVINRAKAALTALAAQSSGQAAEV